MVIIEVSMSSNRFPILGEVSPFPRGALTELWGEAGSGKTELILHFLAENPHFRVAWVEEDFSIYPCAFPQRKVALDRIFFVDVSACSTLTRQKLSRSELAFWAAHQILQSQVFQVVVISVRPSEKQAPVTFRRLQLLAEKSRSAVILLTEQPIQVASWAIPLQLQVGRAGELGEPWVKVLRSKGWRNQSA